MPAIQTIVVPPELDGYRLDVFLARVLPWRSRRDVTQRIEAGKFRVDGQVAKKSTRVRRDQTVEYELPEDYSRPYDPNQITLSILFEDEDVVVIDKAPGDTVHPTSTNPHDSLIHRLRYRYEHEVPDPRVAVHVVHRLDRETSGVLVFAKRKEVGAGLMARFAEREVQKTYVAVVWGDPGDEGVIDAPLLTDEVPVIVSPDGRPARTRFSRVEAGGDRSVLKVLPETGRKHQIRVHLAWRGTPIVGDALYGVATDRRRPGEPGRHLLHASRLEIRDLQGVPRCFEAPVPAEFQA